MKREHQISFWYFAAALLALLVIEDVVANLRPSAEIPYSEFQQLVAAGKVGNLVIGPDRITGTYKASADSKPTPFSTVRVDPALADRLAKDKATFAGQAGPGVLENALVWLLPVLGFALLWMFLIRPLTFGQGNGLMAIGKSKAKVYVEKEVKVTFSDVAGVDEAMDEVKEIVAFLKDPKSYGRLGARVPKGVLLVGPPGTGKTLLARAVAGEAGVPFFSISGSEFVEMFVGVGAARVRDLFEQARKQAPAIVFIDELDALGRARGSSFPGSSHDEKEQTLNQLLSELDGFDARSGVVLLAATNRPEILDPALLRAGRFDRQILVDRPDRKGRAAILRVHLKKVKIAPEVIVEDVAGLTTGFTGADLANLVNEAALLATRRDAESVAAADFIAAIERIVAGLEKRNRLLNPHEREVVAHHEIGHALVAMSLPGVDPVQKVSIIPRGIAALGYTIQRPTEDRFLMDRSELMNRIMVLLGGRAAETLCFDEISTGAGDDLAKATTIARSMVGRFGMDSLLGPVAYEPEQSTLLPGSPAATWQPRWYGEKTAAAMDEAVRAIICSAFESACAILRVNRPLLDRAATELLAKETLSGEELRAIGRALQAGTAVKEVAPADAVPAQSMVPSRRPQQPIPMAAFAGSENHSGGQK